MALAVLCLFSDCASIVGTMPTYTSPVVPSMVISSPSLIVVPPAENRRLRTSTSMELAPTTHGLPIPRATSAAWLAVPPVCVRIPFASTMPCTSLGLVSYTHLRAHETRHDLVC